MLRYIKTTLKKTNTLVVACRLCGSVANKHELITSPNCSETRLLKVAVIGMPNAGKSTFINNLMDRKVCATSAKVHTTRNKAKAIFTEDDAQIIFVDTPGVVSDREHKKYNLQKTFIRDSKNVSKEADIIGVIHDVTNIWTREKLDIKLIKLLDMHKRKPSFLVLNKVDALKSKRKLLDLTRQLTENCINGKPIPGGKPMKKEDVENKGWPFFQEIFMVSSLTGDGLEDVKKFLIDNALPGEWLFPKDIWTDQEIETIITNTVRATLLDFIPQEIPYSLKPEVEYLNVENGLITTVVLINCPSMRITKLVAGASDGKLKQITEAIQKNLQDAFHNNIRIKIVLISPEKDKK
nr:GTPase Era, mitochondrial isoform X1 [Leptinotarsa decemlineata]